MAIYYNVEPKHIDLIIEATTESWTDGRSSTGGRINAAQVSAFIKKMINKAASNWMFLPNDDALRKAAAATIDVQLDYLKQRNGLAEYKVVCDETNNPPPIIDDGKLQLDVYYKPTKSASIISLNVVVGQQGVSIP